MNDKLQKLYDLYVQSGLIQSTDFKTFSNANDQQRKKLYDLGKQSGLIQTTDYNTFNSAFNVAPTTKKKSTTGSQSVQPKKSTSSATMPSWMQSSLESSVKKEEKPKKPAGPQVAKSSELNKDVQAEKIASMAGGGTAGISGVGAINAKPKKEEAPDFDVYYGYPGQEKNEYRISNGRWERKYGDKWVEVTNQGSISSLTKFFGKEKEITVDAVFTGFPGKEENKYRISELQNGKKVWEVQRVGQKDYTVISDQGSIDALNRQFDKKIEYTDDAQSKREAQINRRESASEDFKTVTGNLAGKSSDEVAAYLTKMYGDRGFKFQPVDWPKDRIRISAEGTNISETFDLDNWSDDTDSAEALKIRKFLSENQKLGDYIDLEREDKKKAEEIIVGTELTKEDLSNQMARLTGAGSQAEFELAKKKNVEENITKGLNQQSTDVIEARKALIRSDYDTKQRIDDLTRTAKTEDEKQELAAIAYANKDGFVQKHRVDNNYLNDLNKASKSIDGSFKQLNSDVEEFNRYIKENNITQEQLENDPDLLAQKQELQVRYDQIITDAEDLDFENKKLPFIQNQNARNAALYFAYNETRGSVIGGTWNGFLRGAFGSLQTFRVIDKEGLDSLVATFGSSTTKEFTQSENRNDFSRALLSTSESLGAAAAAFMTGGLAAEGTTASKVLQFIPYFSTSYNEMKNEIDEIPGMNKVPWYKKEALAIAYGIGVGYIDKLSTDFQLKSKISNKIGRDLVLRSIAGLPKGATAEAIEMAIASNFKKDLAAGVIKVVAGAVVEGTTEGVQSAYGSGLKAAYDWMNGVDEFDTREWVSQAFEEAYYGALGGAIMSTPGSLVKGIKNGFGRLDPNDMELARKVIEDSNMRSMIITDIKAKLMSGEITKDQADEQINAIKESMSLLTKIPDDLSSEDTSKSMDLIKERSSIEKQIAGKDESLVAPQKARIAEINNELKTISENATKKSTEQEVTAEGSGVQREGVVEGQPEVGQGEGTVGQTTEQGTDTGNRTVEGRSQEEIDARISELQSMLANDAASVEETGIGSLLPEAKTQIQNELEALKTEVPVKAEMPTVEVAAPKIAETTDTKAYSEALSEAKVALKEEGNGLDLQVSDVSPEEADAIVKEGGKIFMTEDGLAGAYVKKDGYMGGLFKNPKATYKEVAKLLQQARIKVGGRFMDAYATELEKIYVKNGFRPVARLKFNEEYAPEGWDAPGSALAGKPDVVFFAYDPEGKYSIGDGEYVTDYDAAYEMAKNFDAKTANEADRLAAILEKKATVSDDVISREEINKRISLAQKALKLILPDVKFVVHDTNEAFIKATGDLSAGAYDPDTKTIHINAKGANRRTVSHEVFHAIIISKVASDVQLQKLTANMVNSVLKSLKQTGTNQDVIDYLERFAAGYKNDPTVMNEERLAELHGILGENMIELPLPTQNIIKRFLDRLAKMFGLKEMTDREAVEFMNTMSSKVETGKEITDKEFKGESLGRGTINIKSPRKSKFIDSLVFERFPTNKNTRVIENFDIANIDGQVAASTLSDKLTAGRYKNVRVLKGQEIVDAEYIFFGGVGYPEVTGYVWAASRMSDVQKIIDSMVVSEDGYRYLIPAIMSNTSHMSNKNMTSITMEVFKEAIANNELNRTKFKEIVSKAFSNKKGLKFKDGAIAAISGNISATQMCDNLKEYIISSKMTFEARKDILKSMVGDPASGNPKFSTVGTYLSLATSLSEPMAKDADTHQVVVVIRTKGKLTPKKTDKKDPFYHESYGFHIESDQEIEVLHLDSIYNLVDIIPEFINNEGKVVSTEQELKEKGARGWNIKRILTNLGRIHGLAKYSAKISAPKKKSTESSVRQQKPLTTDKDVHPGYETALDALGETEAQIEQWRSENRVNQRQKRNPIVEKAAKDYYNEEITQEEYLDIVSKNQPIKPFKKVPALPTLKEVVNSLDKNKVEKGIVGLTKNINDGERVASRLDIPAYETYDTWVVSVHDGVKEGKSIAYGQTAVLNNVEFKSFSGPAIKMAMGVQNKTPIARMFGNWVNEDPEAVHARAKELMNDPEWVQVGMNPFRHSWFYDKSDGMPLASAEEVVQVGALVLAKNPVKVAPSDPMFETKSSKGGRIRFQKPLEPEVAEKLTEDGKGNFVFNHYSDKKRDMIKPGTGQNNITSREEASALSAVNGLAQYYTMDMQKEPGTGPNQHTILIPKDRVYYFNKDQEGFYDEAKRRFEEVRPGQAFNPNYQVAFITQVANENGYDMVVANWRNGELRAQTTMELTPSDKIINFKPLKEVKYEVGDTVQIYGDIVKITDIDGDIITFKGETSGGSVNFKRSPKSIQKIATPKEQVEEDVKSLEEEMKSDIDTSKFRKQKSEIYKEELDENDINSLRRSLRIKDPNGYIIELLDELQKAKKDESLSVSDEVNDMLENGITLSTIKGILIDEEVFSSGKEVDNYFIQIGGDKTKGIFNRLAGLKSESDTDKSKFRRQKASDQADVIVKTGKEAGLSDAGIREYMNRNGFSGDEITDALQKYNDKREGIFNDPNANKIKKFAINMRKKFLSARGFMPKSGFKYNEERLANIARSLNLADRNISDLNRAIRKMKLSEADAEILMNKFDDYVRGDKSIDLPLPIKKIADSMRDHIDSLSTDLINSGLVDGDLKEKIKNNIGSYMNRSYAVYDNSNWKNEITDEVRQKAINFLKIQMRPIAVEQAAKFNMSVEETLDRMVTNKIKEILTKDMSNDFASGGRKGSKNLDVLKKMEDIPAEIRMLMGEYTDPVQSYAKTILKMSALAANHQFLSQVKESGMGVFLFEENDPRRPEGYTHQIATEGSKSMEPLNGLYTSKEIAKAFSDQSSELGYWLKLYMKSISLVKWGKTVGSPLTHIKNLLGNLGFVMANGHWRLNEMAKSFNTIRADIMNSSNEELRKRIDNYIKLGIIKQSAGINELRSMFEDADWDTTILNRINKKAATRWDKIKSLGFKVKNFTENLYQGEDDFFKVFAYENELSRYSKAMFGKKKRDLTESELKQVNEVVVDIVKNTYPTASRVPELINMIRRFPFLGNFISFQAEAYRTAFNTAHLSMQEIRSDNPGIREIGAQRLAGGVTYTSLKTAILSYFSYMAGMGAVGILGYFTDDEEEKQREKDVRKFVAPWSKDSDLLVISVGKGKIKYVDFSASDPHGAMMKAINAAILGENSVQGLIDALVSVVEPFVGEEMTTQALLNLRGNVNAYGKPIYNPQESFYVKAADIISYLVKAVEPGIASTGRRFAKSEDLKSEVLAGVTGARIYDVDVAENFKFSMMGYKNNIADAKRIYNSAVYSKEATEADKEAAKKRAEKAITRIHKDILDEYHAAIRLGANEEDLYNKLKDFGDMSNTDIDYMFAEEPYFIEYKEPEE